MRSEMASRHRGDLGGRFTDTNVPAHVVIALEPHVALSRTAQHLTWMLVNLLARQSVEIASLELRISPEVATRTRLSPLIPDGLGFAEALMVGLKGINRGVLKLGQEVRSRVFVRVGPGPMEPADFAVATTAAGWSGFVGQQPVDELGDGENPIGAYIAACLCAGEIFKFVRSIRPGEGEFARHVWLDSFNFQVATECSPGPMLPTHATLRRAVLAGVGAVGCAFLQTLFPLEGLDGDITAIDGDLKGLDITNLNRYVLFGLEHRTQPKATLAASVFSSSSIRLEPVDRFWQDWRSENRTQDLDLVVSAFDTNAARHAIQDELPRLILGASTDGLRAQVNRYGLGDGGPCLRCHNPIETRKSDQAVIEELRSLSPGERAQRGAAEGIEADVLESFLSDPHGNCGLISGETLRHFAGTSESEHEWSVGFVSVIAGVLLAAEYLKVCFFSQETSLSPSKSLFRFQFWFPSSGRVNVVASVPVQADCLCQSDLYRRAVLARR